MHWTHLLVSVKWDVDYVPTRRCDHGCMSIGSSGVGKKSSFLSLGDDKNVRNHEFLIPMIRWCPNVWSTIMDFTDVLGE